MHLLAEVLQISAYAALHALLEKRIVLYYLKSNKVKKNVFKPLLSVWTHLLNHFPLYPSEMGSVTQQRGWRPARPHDLQVSLPNSAGVIGSSGLLLLLNLLTQNS